MNTFLFGNAKNKTMVIVRIAIMIAIAVALQFSLAQIPYAAPLIKQLVVGSAVNLALILSAMLTGIIGGIAVGVITPFIALPLGLNPHVIATPFIALANAALVTVFALIIYFLKLREQKKEWLSIIIMVGALAVAAVIKYLLMYFCAQVLFSAFFTERLGANILKALQATWSVTQLFTALIGGAVAIALYYPLRAAKLITPAVPE